MLYILFISLMLILIFNLINCFLKKEIKENYQGIITDSFFDQLNKTDYIINKNDKTITFNNKTISYDGHFNTDKSIITAKNKILTSKILEKNGIPIPQYIEIDLSLDVDEIQSLIYNNKMKYPVVMKPIDGTFGIDVMTDLDTRAELNNTLKYYKDKNYKEIMLEEQIKGDCYRVFVFNNKILDVIKREKPYVIGDGIHTTEKLIEMRNKEQLKMNLLEVKNISLIVIEKQGYKIDDIIPIKEKVYISNVINMHNGARISRIPIDNIPYKNIQLFLNVNKAMNINCSGLDYLSDDITVEYDENDGRILEVNGTPDTEIHEKIKNYNFFEKLVESIF